MINLSSSQIDLALGSAPPNVLYFIEEGLFSERVIEIAERNAVSDSLVLPLAKLCEYALLGLIPPEKFTEELVVLGVPAPAVRAVASAVHEEIINGAATIEMPEADMVPDPEESTGTQAKPQEGIEQRMLPEGHHEVQKTAVVPPKAQVPAPIKVTPAQQKVSVPPASNYPRTMASDVEAMQGGGKPVAPRPVPPPTPRPMPPSRPAPTAATVQEDLKKYGVDPYREPVA